MIYRFHKNKHLQDKKLNWNYETEWSLLSRSLQECINVVLHGYSFGFKDPHKQVPNYE